MSVQNDKIKKDDALILHVKEKGWFVKAWAREDVPGLGQLAFFKVGVNSDVLPGISEMTINVNFWDVWHEDDIEILKIIRDRSVKLEYER